MKAVMFEEHGEVDVLKYKDIPDPKVGPNDVIFKVKAAGCNYNDIWARRGLPGMEIILPHVSGSDASGVVEEVGSEVKSLKPGDDVMVHPGISCRACEMCTSGQEFFCRQYRIWGFQTGPLDGADAEYAKLDQLNASSRKNLADEKPDDELQEIVASFRKRANGANTALRRLRPLPAGATERQQTDHAQHREQLVGITVESSLKAKLLEVAAGRLLELLKRVRRECADRLNSVVRGIEAVSAADAKEVARYEQRLKDRSYLQLYNYELAYPLANERIESLDRQTETWARNFVRSLRFSPDEAPPDREAVRRSLDAAASEGTADSHIDVGAVLGMLVENNHLLHLALNRGRALVEIQGERYETTWSISHSGEDSEKNQLACRELEAAIRAALPGEQFARVTVNAGRLPLREKADVLVVLQEQVIDFQLRQTVSDLEFEAYLEADEEVSNRGGLPIHRLHDRLLRATSATALDWEAP